MGKIAFIFPGQGAQTTGMGLDLFENFDSAKKVFNKADEVLGKSVSKMCFEGPDEVLKQTVNTQAVCLLFQSQHLKPLKKFQKAQLKQTTHSDILWVNIPLCMQQE